MANEIKDHEQWGSQKRSEKDEADNNPRSNPRFHMAPRTTPAPKYTWTGKQQDAGVAAIDPKDPQSVAVRAKQLRDLKEKYRQEKRKLERELGAEQRKIESQQGSVFEKKAPYSSPHTERTRRKLVAADQVGKQMQLHKKWTKGYEEDIERLMHVPQLEKRLEREKDPDKRARLEQEIKRAEERADRKLYSFEKKTKPTALRRYRQQSLGEEREFERRGRRQRNELDITFRQEEKELRSSSRSRDEKSLGSDRGGRHSPERGRW